MDVSYVTVVDNSSTWSRFVNRLRAGLSMVRQCVSTLALVAGSDAADGHWSPLVALGSQVLSATPTAATPRRDRLRLQIHKWMPNPNTYT